MRKILLSIIALFVLSFAFASVTNAQLKDGAFTKYSEATFGGVYETGTNLETSLPLAIGNVISIALSFIGVIMLVIMVYAGFLWLTAGGSDEQVGKAKKWIKNAIIGAAIALAAYIITSFVIQKVEQSVGIQASAPAAGSTNNAKKP